MSIFIVVFSLKIESCNHYMKFLLMVKSQEAFALLGSLRSFRHFFRHACTYDADPKKAALVFNDDLKLRKIYKRDHLHFMKKIQRRLRRGSRSWTEGQALQGGGLKPGPRRGKSLV